jgi:hypothetical protein
MNDGFGFMLTVLVLLGILHGYLKNHNKKPILSDYTPISEDSEKFDDSEGDGLMMFDDALFPAEFEDIEE